MTDEEALSEIFSAAGRLAAPLLKQGATDIIAATWSVFDEAQEKARQNGATDEQVLAARRFFKRANDIVEPGDVVDLGATLEAALSASFQSAVASADGEGPQLLEERVIKGISGFRVTMYTDEGKHPGRPHVTFHLADGKVNISIEKEPKALTPTSGIRNVSAAKKAVVDNRKTLLKAWRVSRADTQKLPSKQRKRRSEPKR